MHNLLDNIPHQADEELFTLLLTRPGLRLERIVSTGQSTPEDSPFDQDSDEWVLLIAGAAGLWMEGIGERDLKPGDWLLIPAHCAHRVTWTSKNEPIVSTRG